MKCYIFITFDLSWVGGGQCYVATKAKYLEQTGWDVFVFAPRNKTGKHNCPIDFLNKYTNYSMFELSYPPHLLPNFMVTSVINRMKNVIGNTKDSGEILIESHNDITALWGELLAKKLNARHFFWTANEKYRLPNQYYKEKIDLFIYKLERREIFGSHNTVNRLLEGYRTISEAEFEKVQIDEDPVQDVDNPKVNGLLQLDWNIGYIGRSNKPYMSNIISDIGFFCSRHKEKKIQLVVVGEVGSHLNEINIIKDQNNNLTVTELGNLHPLPRMLFKKLDVVIAGSGSARCSVYEGALTILADPETGLSNGLLGYDTIDSVYKGENGCIYSFNDVLERALVKETYLNMENRFPPKKGVAECTAQNFRLIEKAEPTKAYFDEKEICRGRKNYKVALGIFIRRCLNRFYYNSLH